MSFETNAIDGPKDLASLNEVFKVSAVDREIQVAAPPVANVGITQKLTNEGIQVDPDLTDQMSGVEAYLQNAGNTSIIGECFAQGMKMGQDTVGDFSNTWGQKVQPQEITVSNDGQKMDVTEVAQTWTPNLTPNSPFA